MLEILNELKDETALQIEQLGYEADHRLETIRHSHNVHVVAQTGSSEGTPDGAHATGAAHVHAMDSYLTGIPPLTDAVGPHFSEVSDQLTDPTDYSKDEHGHHQHVEPGIIYEAEHPVSASAYTASIIAIGARLKEDVSKMENLESNHYVGVSEFNTGYGTPWTEIYKLDEKIDIVEQYASDFPNLQWLGEKHTLIALMHTVMTYAVDAKWALRINQDYIQKGFDKYYNDDTPSIVFDSFTEGSTIGNFQQEYSENVHVAAPNTDPF